MVGAAGLQSRAGNFHAIGRSSITSAIVQTLGQIAGGLVSWGALGLMAGFTLGRISNAASLAPCSGLGRPVGIRQLATTARDWRRFPALVMTPPSSPTSPSPPSPRWCRPCTG